MTPPATTVGTLDLIAVRGARGWRFAEISDIDKTLLSAVHVGGDVHEPRRLKHVGPKYTDAARPLLDAAAIEAVRQWEYAPTLLNGRPVPVIMAIKVEFHF